MRAIALIAAALALAGVGFASAGSVPACRGASMAATFTVLPGSPRAGNIVYTLRLRNRGHVACFVSGLPTLRLLGRSGNPLPTHVRAGHPGRLTAVRVVLAPGGYASASARFSPDVPGPGEAGPCEPVAYRVRIVVPPGGGTASGPVDPPTRVCEHGSLAMTTLVAGKKGPSTA